MFEILYHGICGLFYIDDEFMVYPSEKVVLHHDGFEYRVIANV